MCRGFRYLLHTVTFQLSMPCAMESPPTPNETRQYPKRIGIALAEKSGHDSPTLQAGPSNNWKSCATRLARLAAALQVPKTQLLGVFET
jgi:hypothetical protein